LGCCVVEKEIGRVSHYYTHLGVAVVELTDELRIGDEILIKGATTNFQQKVDSMQIEHKPVDVAGAGDSIGLKTLERVREGDIVFKVNE